LLSEALLRPALTMRTLRKRLLKQLSSLPLAIGELFVLAGLSAVGTVIDQNETADFYQQMYPNSGEKVRTHCLLASSAARSAQAYPLCAAQVLGFLTSDLIHVLQWDHIYSANYFMGLLALLAASLAACSSTRFGIWQAGTNFVTHCTNWHRTAPLMCPAQATAYGEGSKAVAISELARAGVEARQCCYAIGSIIKRPWAKAERKWLPGEGSSASGH